MLFFWKVDASILPCELVVGAPFPAMSCSILFALNTVLSLAGLFHIPAAGISLLLFLPLDEPFTSICTNKILPCPFLQCSLHSVFQYLHAILTSASLLNLTTTFELILQLSCPPHTFWMCPLSYCDVAIAGTGEAKPHSSGALVGCEFAPSLLRWDLSAGPLAGE